MECDCCSPRSRATIELGQVQFDRPGRKVNPALKLRDWALLLPRQLRESFKLLCGELWIRKCYSLNPVPNVGNDFRISCLENSFKQIVVVKCWMHLLIQPKPSSQQLGTSCGGRYSCGWTPFPLVLTQDLWIGRTLAD